MLTVGELKKYIEENNISDNEVIYIGHRDHNEYYFAQKVLERGINLNTCGFSGIMIRADVNNKEEKRGYIVLTDEQKLRVVNKLLRHE